MTISPELAISIAINSVILIRWLVNKYSKAKINENFVHSVATNHLPHIYHALEQIADKLEVNIGERPEIEFVDVFNGK